MDMRPHPNKWLTTGLAKPAIVLAVTNTALALPAIPAGTGKVVVCGGMGKVVTAAEVLVAVIPAITIPAIPMPVGHAHHTTRTSLQGLVVMEVQPPVLI